MPKAVTHNRFLTVLDSLQTHVRIPGFRNCSLRGFKPLSLVGVCNFCSRPRARRRRHHDLFDIVDDTCHRRHAATSTSDDPAPEA